MTKSDTQNFKINVTELCYILTIIPKLSMLIMLIIHAHHLLHCLYNSYQQVFQHIFPSLSLQVRQRHKVNIFPGCFGSAHLNYLATVVIKQSNIILLLLKCHTLDLCQILYNKEPSGAKFRCWSATFNQWSTKMIDLDTFQNNWSPPFMVTVTLLTLC